MDLAFCSPPITVKEFKGLYLRGMNDECPTDHSPECLNVWMTKRGEVASRPGTSLSISCGHYVVRMFAASNSNTPGAITLLTCDGNGNIYANGSDTPWLTVSDMIDFAAINMFNKTFIAPITSTNNSQLYVWDGINAPRLAAGAAPTIGSMAATLSGSGNVGPGTYSIWVSYITNTGFTTPPVGPITVVADGSHSIVVSNIPTGGSDVVARQILISQGNLLVAYYIADGLIDDNTTTTVTLNFYDTDLAVSADDLFDLLPEIPTGFLYSGVQKYNGRLLVWGVTDSDVGNVDMILVSNVDSAESFNAVTGFIQLPTENDGNTMAGAFVINEILYMTKSVGIFYIQDNGGEPQTWAGPFPVDGVAGAGHFGIGTVTMTQQGLTADNVVLIADYGGIRIFNGSVVEPPLTWKIQDVWNSIFRNSDIPAASIAIDPFNQIIYVLVPVNNDTFPNVLLAGFYGEGLDAMSIKWTRICLPSAVTAIGMLTYKDIDGAADWFYYLRIACIDGNVYKLHTGYVSDFGQAIDSHYQTAYLTKSNGGMNIFPALRIRANGPATALNLTMYNEDNTQSLVPVPLVLQTTTGKEYFRQTTTFPENEKCAVKFGTYAVADQFKVNRLDIFSAEHFVARPQQGTTGI